MGRRAAFVESVRYNWNITKQTFAVLGKIFSREVAAKSALSGPIEIASLAGAAARSGFKNLVYLMGFISISIAILNLLPVPILDGGQIAHAARSRACCGATSRWRSRSASPRWASCC